MLQTNTGRIALDCLLSVSGGGAAYLPVSLIRQYLDEKRLFIVPDAPVVNRTVYASFQADSSRKELISDIIGLIRDQLSQTELL